MVPLWVIETLTAAELRVYAVLAAYRHERCGPASCGAADGGRCEMAGSAWPSHATVARHLGVSVSAVRKHVAAIADKGAIVLDGRKGGRAKRMDVDPPGVVRFFPGVDRLPSDPAVPPSWVGGVNSADRGVSAQLAGGVSGQLAPNREKEQKRKNREQQPSHGNVALPATGKPAWWPPDSLQQLIASPYQGGTFGGYCRSVHPEYDGNADRPRLVDILADAWEHHAWQGKGPSRKPGPRYFLNWLKRERGRARCLESLARDYACTGPHPEDIQPEAAFQRVEQGVLFDRGGPVVRDQRGRPKIDEPIEFDDEAAAEALRKMRGKR